jgi:hypothetical protein
MFKKLLAFIDKLNDPVIVKQFGTKSNPGIMYLIEYNYLKEHNAIDEEDIERGLVKYSGMWFSVPSLNKK